MGKDKPRFVVRGKTFVKERLGWNKVLFNASQGQTANTSINQMQTSQCSLRQDDRSLATYHFLILLQTKLTQISPCRFT